MAYQILPEFAGVSPDTLRSWLGQAQQALQDLETGAKVETAAYAQGDGQKSVTYTRASIPALRMRIRALTQALGLGYPRRRPARPLFL